MKYAHYLHKRYEITKFLVKWIKYESYGENFVLEIENFGLRESELLMQAGIEQEEEVVLDQQEV